MRHLIVPVNYDDILALLVFRCNIFTKRKAIPEKYEWVISERLKGNNKYLFDLNPLKKETWLPGEKDKCVFRIMWTKSLWPLYFTIFLVAEIILVYSLCK